MADDKFLLGLMQEAVFPARTKKTGQLDATKLYLLEILYSDENVALQDGVAPKDIALHHTQQWLIKSVKTCQWFKILCKYKNINETLDTNFLSDFNEIAEEGMKAGQDSTDIREVNRLMQRQLRNATK
eukprot:2963415-Rhodomonas_salina.1